MRVAIGATLALLGAYGAAAVRRLESPPETGLEFIAWLAAPLLIALGLGVVLVVEARRMEKAHAASADSEQRFRMAVEAARCGIWEWDLTTDSIFMSDVTAALFGWRGGVVEGQQVLDRVSPGHRDGLRDALATAAVYGGFDVSFRVPSLIGGRPVWIDARGQGFGKSREGGYARIIGVALDVTEERLAQARAQAAETRLRDAIDSVSEAFVLWDRRGRLLMCNNAYREFFSLEPRLLKPGASHDAVERVADLAVRQWLSGPEGAQGVREAELIDGRWVQISER
ncbi:MAG: hypothetical protein JWP49_2802, partial [Phenylobacterium sp.]|nr:hypothetical protein [Phenylobacterium sp.]